MIKPGHAGFEQRLAVPVPLHGHRGRNPVPFTSNHEKTLHAGAADCDRDWQIGGRNLDRGDEEDRRAAGATAEATEFNGPPSWAALAAFWSGGSLAPPELPEVPPGEALTAQAITGALMMAATHGDPLKAADRYRGFLEEGKKLATSQ